MLRSAIFLAWTALAAAPQKQQAIILHDQPQSTNLNDPCNVAILAKTYNAHDAHALAALFSPTIKSFEFPSQTPFITGRGQLEQILRDGFTRFPMLSLGVLQSGRSGDFCFHEFVFDIGNGTLTREIEILELTASENGLATREWIVTEADEDQDVPLVDPTPACEYVSQGLVDAFNEGNVHAFAEWFDQDVKNYEFPHRLVRDGRDSIVRAMKGVFESSRGWRSRLGVQISVGRYCLNHVVAHDAAGSEYREMAFLQEIGTNGLITSCWDLQK